eukprot:Rmarinus@m.24864
MIPMLQKKYSEEVDTLEEAITVLARNRTFDDPDTFEETYCPSTLDSCVGITQDDLDAIETVMTYAGPAPVQSFDEFVALAEIMTALSMDEENAWLLDLLNEVDDATIDLRKMVNLGTLSFAPDSPEVWTVVDYLNETNTLFYRKFGGVFANEDDAVDDATDRGHNEVWAVIYFQTIDTTNQRIEYKIRMNHTVVPSTFVESRDLNRGLDVSYSKYYFSGFLAIQRSIDVLFAADDEGNIDGHPADDYYVVGCPAPTEEYDENQLYDHLNGVLGIYLIMATLPPFLHLSTSIHRYDAVHLLDIFAASRVRPWEYLFGLAGVAFVVVFVIAIFGTILLDLTVLDDSAYGPYFVVLLLYFISCILLILAVAPLAARTAAWGAFVGPAVIIILMLPSYAFYEDSDEENYNTKTSACVLAPTCFALANDIFMEYEEADLGVSWHNIWDRSFSVANCIIMLFIDCWLYFVLTWYTWTLFGTRRSSGRSPYFPLQPSYWFSLVSKTTNDVTAVIEAPRDTLTEGYHQSVSETPIIACHRIYCTGRSSEGGVLLGASFVGLVGRTVALVGKAGAGQSTAAKVLAGIHEFQGGSRGFAVGQKMGVGYCPRDAGLLPELTVLQQLQLHSSLLGLSAEKSESTVLRLIHAFRLWARRQNKISSLSPTDRRLLSCACALAGDTTVVVLDEPTSGMTWRGKEILREVLAKEKQKRAIIIATTDPEVAEDYSDFIYVFQQGAVMASGTVEFLKARLGVGQAVECWSGGGEGLDALSVVSVARSVIPEVKADMLPILDSNEEQTPLLLISLGVPPEAEGQVYDLVNELSYRRFELGLEDVAVRVAPFSEVLSQVERTTLPDDSQAKFESSSMEISAARMCARFGVSAAEVSSLHQFFALCVARAKSLASHTAFVGKVSVPIVFVLLALGVLSLPKDESGPSLLLNVADIYEANTDVAYAASGEAISEESIEYLRQTLTNFYQVEADSPLGLEDSLARTFYSHEEDRYGAYYFGNETSLIYTWSPLDMMCMIIGGLSQVECEQLLSEYYEDRTGDTWGRYHTTPLYVMHNTSSAHAWPAFVASSLEASLESRLQSRHVALRTRSHPLPYVEHEESEVRRDLSQVAAASITFAFAIFPVCFAGVVLREGECGSRLRSVFSRDGVAAWAYWGSLYVLDALVAAVAALLTLAILILFDWEEFTDDGDLRGATLVLLTVYGFAMLPYAYLVGLLSRSEYNAQVVCLTYGLSLGFIPLIISIVLRGAEGDGAGTANEYLCYVFRFSPAFLLGEGLLDLCLAFHSEQLEGDEYNPFDWDVTARNDTLLACHAIVVGIAVVVANNLLSTNPDTVPDIPVWAPFEESDDVKLLRQRAEHATLQGDNVVVMREALVGTGLTFDSVGSLSMVVRRGQRFGLCGLGGSGISTAAALIAGVIPPAEGEVFVKGIPAVRATQLTGWCPPFNAVMSGLTGAEYLELRARLRCRERLRGAVSNVVDTLLQAFGLTAHRDDLCDSYTDGQMRCLCVAAALIGDPTVVVVDSPTAGASMEARGRIWNVLRLLPPSTTIVLASESLEECHTLTSVSAVMVDGILRCVGPIRLIRRRFMGAAREPSDRRGSLSRGSGADDSYVLLLRGTDRMMIDETKEMVLHRLPNAKLIDERDQRLTFVLTVEDKMPSLSAAVAETAKCVREIKAKAHIGDFYVGIPSLHLAMNLMVSQTRMKENRLDEVWEIDGIENV